MFYFLNFLIYKNENDFNKIAIEKFIINYFP